MNTRHFTAWMVNDPSALDQACMDVTVLEDRLIGGDPKNDDDWSTDSSKEHAFYAVTTVDAVDGDGQDGCNEAEELLRAAGWETVGAWRATDNAYILTVERDDPMTPAEFRVVREYLGFTGDRLAEHLGVSSRTVRHWEAGRYAIPDGIRLEMEDLERRTGEFVAGVIERLNDMPEPGVVTYRDDEEYHAAHPEIPYPASWHRAVVARVAQEVPGLAIAYATSVKVADPK